MKQIELKMDRMVQEWASKQRSYVSCFPAECGHHFYHRSIRLLRWDLLNIIPLTFDEHQRHHAGLLDIEIQNPFRAKYLQEKAQKNLKDHLLENGLTEDEWLKKCYLKLEQKNDEAAKIIPSTFI